MRGDIDGAEKNQDGTDSMNCKVRLLYDDGSQGELDMTKAKASMLDATVLVGLTLKQAKMRLGIKS